MMTTMAFHTWRSDEVERWSLPGSGSVLTECYHAERYGWTDPYQIDSSSLVLMRRGAYRRRNHDAGEHVVDLSTGFWCNAGEEASNSNFTGEPEEITTITVAPELISLVVAEGELPGGPFPVDGRISVAHTELLAAIERNDDPLAVEERVVALLGLVATRRSPDRVRGTRRRAASYRRAVVSDACELLNTTRGAITLTELADAVAASPFHLSRVFRAVTGRTISQYRQSLRVHQVIERLAAGAEDLAAVACEAGFADHSHMTRTVVAHCGEAPSSLRRRFAID